MVFYESDRTVPLMEGGSRNVDAYALFEALTGRKVDTTSAPSGSQIIDGYDELDEWEDRRESSFSGGMKPDNRPKNVRIGAINPFALVEALIGRELDKRSESAIKVISDVLQTDYDELFDMKHNSVLFAGVQLNKEQRMAEELNEQDVKIVEEQDLVTPDLAELEKLEDLEKVGMKDFANTRIKMARLSNGNLRLILEAHKLGKTVCNRRITMSINDLACKYRRNGSNQQWTPPNATWQDVYSVFYDRIARRMITDNNDFRVGRNHHFHGSYNGYMNNMMQHYHHGNRFDDPVQGATSNSWFVAALFSVFWANPADINRHTRCHNRRLGGGGMSSDPGCGRGEKHMFEVKFYDQGGSNNAKTEKIKVDFQLPINNSSNEPLYCRASDFFEVWPALYEKAFAKWMTGDSSERPDITQMSHGDPIKCMAQLNGREPQYFFCEGRTPRELAGLVRQCSVNHKCINPMAAYTYATDSGMYRGLNLVANHAYSVLGWSSRGQSGEKQYIILRNPWGVTDPQGLNSYPGLIDRVEAEYWPPMKLLDRDGVFALEAQAFKKHFQCIGVAR